MSCEAQTCVKSLSSAGHGHASECSPRSTRPSHCPCRVRTTLRHQGQTVSWFFNCYVELIQPGGWSPAPAPSSAHLHILISVTSRVLRREVFRYDKGITFNTRLSSGQNCPQNTSRGLFLRNEIPTALLQRSYSTKTLLQLLLHRSIY
jgi:hypothetical protein